MGLLKNNPFIKIAHSPQWAIHMKASFSGPIHLNDPFTWKCLSPDPFTWMAPSLKCTIHMNSPFSSKKCYQLTHSAQNSAINKVHIEDDVWELWNLFKMKFQVGFDIFKKKS